MLDRFFLAEVEPLDLDAMMETMNCSQMGGRWASREGVEG